MIEFESALKINELIKKNQKYLTLKEREKVMLDDKDTFKLLVDYQKKQDEYNEALKYKDYGSNPGKVQKELADIKYLVDTNELVKNYNLAYKELIELLNQVNETILEGVIK